MRNLLCVLPVFCGLAVSGQTATGYKGGYNNHITVIYTDHTVTAGVRPSEDAPSPDASKTYYWYSANAIRTTVGGYSGKLLDGSYNDFYSNKNIKEQGSYKHGLKTGNWRSWDERGNLLNRENWRAGQKNGSFYSYDNKGTLLREGKYHAGRLQGRQVTYTDGKGSVTYFRKGSQYEPKHSVSHFLSRLNPIRKKPAKKK